VATVLGLEHPLLRSGAAEDERPVSLAQLAARHAGSLVHASGLSRPHLVGESFGAVLAHATATTAEALGARPRLLAMVEPTPPRPYWKEFDAPASWSLAPPSFDAPFFLRLTGVELEAAAAARLGRLSAAQQLHGVVEVLVARGLAPDTAASARQVSRLASVTTLCQAALERQPRKLPPRTHEAGTLLLVANQRRQFFEQFVALVHVAEVAQLDAYGARVRAPMVLAASHFQAIHRILAQPESRLQATLAAAVLCTSPGMRRSSLTLTKAECAVGRRM
jgi:thioesterase domain-containing protein